MSHRSLRSPLVPFTTGLAAVIAVLAVGAAGVAGSGPAFGVGSGTGAVAADPVRAHEWWLAGLNVTQAWRQTQGAGVTVAVLGTGVAVSHPDLAGDVLTGPDYSDSGRTPGGPFWGIDGTQVAAIIAGHGHGTDRQSGIAGVAPAAKILSVRVNLEFNDPLNSEPAVTRRLPGAIAAGITYAVNHGARVIDLPLDPGTFGLAGHSDRAAAGGSPAEQAAVSYALRKSVVLVAPAGDDGEGPALVNYPAAYTGVIAVGAVSRDGRLAPFSSRRSHVSLTAPGVGLLAATPPAGYATISSTSAASGIVAGVAALLLARFPHLTVAQVTEALTKSTATNAGTADAGTVDAAGPGTGYGTVDAARAVNLAADITAATPAPTAATPSVATASATAPSAEPARPASAASRRADASALAGSLVRDLVAALGGLIVLVIALLLIMSSRRRRALASSGTGRTRSPRGQHGHRRPEQAPGPDPGAAGPIRSQLATPAGVWPAPGGWQGGSVVGEIAHPAAAPSEPVIAPVPRPARPGRPGRAGTPAKPAEPPWSPAPEPERTIGSLPVTLPNSFRPNSFTPSSFTPSSFTPNSFTPNSFTPNSFTPNSFTPNSFTPEPPPGSFTPEPGRGIRVPPDMTTLPAAMSGPGAAFDPTNQPAFDLTEGPKVPAFLPPVTGFPPPATGFPPSAPGFPPPVAGLPSPTPGFPGPATDPGAEEPAALSDSPRPATIPDFARLGTRKDTAHSASGSATSDPDLTDPDLAGPDIREPGATGAGVTGAGVTGAGATGPDVTDPDATGPITMPDLPSRRSLGFAAAPVAIAYQPPDVPSAYPPAPRPVPRAAADSSYIWDLAATDVFPVAPAEPPDSRDDDAPGASKS